MKTLNQATLVFETSSRAAQCYLCIESEDIHAIESCRTKRSPSNTRACVQDTLEIKFRLLAREMLGRGEVGEACRQGEDLPGHTSKTCDDFCVISD